jgi:hypothetical protein
MTRSIGIIVILLAFALGGGWWWGASGRGATDRALHTLELQHDLVVGRSALLEARLSIYSVNFGQASQHFEDARAALGRAHVRLTELGRVADVAQIQLALSGIDDAQQMAGKLDQNANSRAEGVAAIVADVITAATKAGLRP